MNMKRVKDEKDELPFVVVSVFIDIDVLSSSLVRSLISMKFRNGLSSLSFQYFLDF